MLSCRYFDGRSSRTRTASADIDGDALRIVGDGFDRIVERAELTFVPATDRGPARIAIASGGLCEFDDRAGAEALFARFGHRRSHADRLVSRTRHVVAVVVAFVAVMAALYVWGIPWAADEFVAHSPPQWEEKLGDHVLDALDERKVFRPSTLSPERQKEIMVRFARLRLPADAPKIRPVIEFRHLGAPNALALPGNLIIVTDEIVELADDDDALLTVIAHEMGHIEHRDAMRQLVRGTMASLVAAWYLGDASNAAAAVAGSVGTLTYSREAEHRADLFARDVMHANGISTHSAAELFRRLEAWQPPAKPDAKKKNRFRLEIPEYFSTHPATEDRITLFEDEPEPSTGPH